jgi:O-antigen/teichoic acid export membrane protein
VSDGARRIFANTLYRGLADIGSKIATTLLFIVMARKLGVSQFGVFVFALSLVTLVSVLADFGQNAVLTRDVARNRNDIHRQFANNLAMKIVLAVPTLAIAVAVVAATTTGNETRDVVALLGVAVVAELLRGTCFAVFEAHERMGFIPVVLISQRFLTTIVGVAALLMGAGVVAVSAIYLGGAVLAFLLALALMYWKVARPRPTISLRIWWPLLHAAIPIGLAGAFGTVLFRVDAAMLAIFEPKDVVGSYGAAYRLFEATLFIGWSIGAAVYPVFSRLTPSTETPVGVVYERALKFSLFLTVPLAVGAMILAGPIVDLVYGSSYDDAVTSLRLLGPAIPLYAVAYIAGLLLVARHRQRVLTIAMGVVAFQNIAANFILIPWLSLNGAALGTSVSEALVTVPLLVYGARACEGFHWLRVFGGPLVAGAACAVAMGLLVHSPVAAVLLGGLAYLAVFGAFEHRIFPDDVRGALSLLRRRPALDPPLPEPDLQHLP